MPGSSGCTTSRNRTPWARFLGHNLNILPLFMIGTQFWQMQLTPKSGDASQQKMMMFMPLSIRVFLLQPRCRADPLLYDARFVDHLAALPYP